MFVLFRILPTGDPARLRAGRNASPKVIAAIRHDLGLDKSLPAQFWIYMKQVFLHFNLGYSYYSNSPVRGLIVERLGATLSLMLGASFIWVATGLPIGIVSALRRRSWLDRASMGTALVFVSAPEYWLGLIALYLFAADIGQVKIFPGAGSYVSLDERPVEMVHLAAAAVARARRGLGRDLRAADARQSERSDARGLHPHRAREGPERASRRPAPRRALGDQPDPDDPRARHRHAARRRDPRRSRVQHPRHRPARLHRDQALGSADRAGHRVAGAMFIIVANIVVDVAYAYLDPRVRYE